MPTRTDGSRRRLLLRWLLGRPIGTRETVGFHAADLKPARSDRRAMLGLWGAHLPERRGTYPPHANTRIHCSCGIAGDTHETRMNGHRHRGSPAMEDTPATPPGMRVRTRRFESLRSGQPWHSQPVKVRNGQNGLDDPVAVTPPAVAVARHLFGHIFRSPQCLELAINRLWPLPMLELDGP